MKHRRPQIKFCIIYLAFGMIISTLFTTTSFAAGYDNMRMAAGYSHTLLIDAEGNVWAFGNNSDGQLGDGSTTSKDTPVMVYSKGWSGKAVSVAAGASQSLALLEDGTVLMWGYGSPVQKTGIKNKAAAIAAGESMCMAILTTGEAVCWNATSGPLPVKTENMSVLQNVKEISAGKDNFLILRAGEGGSVYQLHISPGNDCWIASKVAISSESSSPSSSSPSSSSPSPSSTEYLNAESISAGNNFGVALLNGEVYTWGTESGNGVLGQGTFTVTVGGVEPAKKVKGLSSISKISAGTDHVIAVSASGSVFGWGNAGNLRLDAARTNTRYSIPESLDISGISQYDCGNTSNVMTNSAGEFYTWGNNKAMEKLTLKQALLKTSTPSVAASLVGSQTMTITWNPQDYYTEMATGFMVTYAKPDGTAGKTQLLPLTISQITLRGLQAATNYKITLSIFGKTGFEEAAPVLIVQTAKDEGLSSSMESSATVRSPDPTNTQGAAEEISSRSGEDSQSKGEIASLFNLIMIILIILALAFAVIAFIYIWKRLDRAKPQKIKPIRVSPDASVEDSIGIVGLGEKDGNSDKADMDMKIIPEKEPVNPPIPVLYEEDNKEFSNIDHADSTEWATTESDDNNKPEESLPAEDKMDQNVKKEDEKEGEEEEEFLTRLPDPHDYNGHDEDDFIIRKPGEPLK